MQKLNKCSWHQVRDRPDCTYHRRHPVAPHCVGLLLLLLLRLLLPRLRSLQLLLLQLLKLQLQLGLRGMRQAWVQRAGLL